MALEGEPLRRATSRTSLGSSTVTEIVETTGTRSKSLNGAARLSIIASSPKTTRAADFRQMLARPSLKSPVARTRLSCVPECLEPTPAITRASILGAVVYEPCAQPPCSVGSNPQFVTNPDHASRVAVVDRPVRPPSTWRHHDSLSSPDYSLGSAGMTRRYHSIPNSKARNHTTYAPSQAGGAPPPYATPHFPSILESHHLSSFPAVPLRDEMARKYPFSPPRTYQQYFRSYEPASAPYLSRPAPSSSRVHDAAPRAPGPALPEAPALLSPVGPSTLDGLDGFVRVVERKRPPDTFSHSAFLYGFRKFRPSQS